MTKADRYSPVCIKKKKKQYGTEDYSLNYGCI